MGADDKNRRRRRWPWVLAGVLAALVALVAALPAVVCAVDWPEMEFDLAPRLGPGAEFFSNSTARVKFAVSRGAAGGFSLKASGRLLDWPFTAHGTVRFGWLRAEGSAALRLDDTPWRVNARFAAPSTREWNADVELKETAFDQADPLLAPVLAKLPAPGVSNLAFSARVRAEAHVERTARVPVPAWSAHAELRDGAAELFAGDVPVAVRGMRLRAGAAGIADHLDVEPIRPRVDAVEAAGFSFTNFHATVYASEKSYLVTEAGAGFCGGDLRLYSLRLNPETLTAGFTFFLDGVDAGQVLARIPAFRGTATGRLHGKLPLFLKNGRELRLRDAYLYSIPGETGTVRIEDPGAIIESLAARGVSSAECENVAKALANLAYTSLKVELKRDEDGGLALSLGLAGSATSGSTTVPVSVAVTFHGDIDQLLNTGLMAMRKQERK